MPHMYCRVRKWNWSCSLGEKILAWPGQLAFPGGNAGSYLPPAPSLFSFPNRSRKQAAPRDTPETPDSHLMYMLQLTAQLPPHSPVRLSSNWSHNEMDQLTTPALQQAVQQAVQLLLTALHADEDVS